MRNQVVLRVVAKLLIPYILLYGFYVQCHGDFGPGGGFQAGVIFGAGCILYGLVFGVDALIDVIPLGVVRVVAAGGLLLYTLVGVAGLLSGGNYLDYSVLAEDPVAGQHLGILLIELGVGMTVAAVAVSLYYGFTNR